MLIKASYLILATVFFAATWFVPALSNYASGAAVLTGALFSWFLKNPFQEHSHRLVPTFLGRDDDGRRLCAAAAGRGVHARAREPAYSSVHREYGGDFGQAEKTVL